MELHMNQQDAMGRDTLQDIYMKQRDEQWTLSYSIQGCWSTHVFHLSHLERLLSQSLWSRGWTAQVPMPQLACTVSTM
eukprot:scaffold455245_cov20-Prasinocladus_malaysianus.AAC.1